MSPGCATSAAEALHGAGRCEEAVSPELVMVPVDKLRTGLEPLRKGGKPARADQPKLAQLPLRAVRTDDDGFEVIDGFKRLACWLDQGRQQVPVVVERPLSAVEQKAAVLRANSPRRTIGPMDTL